MEIRSVSSHNGLFMNHIIKIYYNREAIIWKYSTFFSKIFSLGNHIKKNVKKIRKKKRSIKNKIIEYQVIFIMDKWVIFITDKKKKKK